ncbi:MAG: hypothetical protein K8J08_19830, partial [Thermoanaerobaculia bacterium]|nr:hypothetical protein [Thermoanaerobaculia bacterium]
HLSRHQHPETASAFHRTRHLLGPRAEEMSGPMKSRGRLWMLVPREVADRVLHLQEVREASEPLGAVAR